MKRIDVEFNGNEYTFRTNDSGDYLFVGVGENNQISCESGFNSLLRMKRAIREHLRFTWGSDQHMPRIKYTPSNNCEWRTL